MLQDAFAGLEAKIQSLERSVALFQHINHAQRLQIVLEAAMILHAVVERILAGVAERRVPEIVRQRYGLHQIFVQPEIASHRSSDLRDFNAVGQAGSEQIAFMIDENLGLVFETPKRRGVNDAVTIPLEFAATDGRLLR